MALHKAILEGRLVQFRILLQGVKGVDPNARDHNSKTPLMVCSSVSHERLSVIFASHLLSWGADVGLPDKRGRNALCWACWKGTPKLVEVLLDAHPDTCFYDLRQTDNRGNTALHYAALGGDKLIVKMIIETFLAMNTPLNPFNNHGETPVDVAVKHKNIEGAKVFVDLGQAQILLDSSDNEHSPTKWLPSEIGSQVLNGSRKTSLMMSDGRRIKSAFSGQKEVYRHKQRVEAEGGTAIRKKEPMISKIYNAFESQFSYLYRSGATTPPEPEVVEEEPDLALSSAAQVVKFAHMLKQGKQDMSRAPSTTDTYSRGASVSGTGGGESSSSGRGASRMLNKRKSSMGFNKDMQGGGGTSSSGRTSSMRGNKRSMSRSRSRVGSSMGMGNRSRQRPMSRQQSMGGKKSGASDNKRGSNTRSDRARLNSAKAKLRLPMRQTRHLRFLRRGSWPTDPATIRRLLPKEVDPFRSKGVNSMKRWRSEWDLDSLSMLQIGLDKSTGRGKGRLQSRQGSKSTPRGGGKMQKNTPRRGGKGGPDSFRKGFKLDLTSSSFVDISDLQPSRSPTLLTNRSNVNANMSSVGGSSGLSPTPTSARNKSPVKSKKNRNKEPVAEVVVQPVRSASWINRRIRKLQEDIRILDARQRSRARKQKSILKMSSYDEDDFLQQSMRSIRIRDTSDEEPRTGIVRQPTKSGNNDTTRTKKRVRIVTRQNSSESSEKSDNSSSDEEFSLADTVKTAELLRAFLDKHHFSTYQDRFLPDIIRRPAVAPHGIRESCNQIMTSVSLTSKPRLPNRPATSLYPGQGHIVADAETLARYHSNPLSNVGINPSVGEKYNQKMQVSKPVPGFWRPYRPIWMG